MAITPVFCCGFECACTGHVFFTPSAEIGYVTSGQRSGARALRLVKGGSVGGVGSQFVDIPVAKDIFVFRVYVYFTTLPTANTALIDVFAVSSSYGGAFFQASDNKIYAGTAASVATSPVFGATGVAVVTGQWYRLDVRVNNNANPWLVDVQVNGVACGQRSSALTASTATVVEISLNSLNSGTNANTFDVIFDDYLLSHTSADYPLGAGYVHHYVPGFDGAHNIAGASDFERGTTGTDILNGTTDAYTLIDDIPLPSVVTDDSIAAVAPPAGTDYVEVTFVPAPGSNDGVAAPRAVEFVVATHQSGTGLGDFKVNASNGALGAFENHTTIVEQVQVAGVTTLKYATKQLLVAPGGGSWGASYFVNDSGSSNRLRFFSNDANPDQFLDAAMIEAEFASVEVASDESSNPGQIGPVRAALQ